MKESITFEFSSEEIALALVPRVEKRLSDMDFSGTFRAETHIIHDPKEGFSAKVIITPHVSEGPFR